MSPSAITPRCSPTPNVALDKMLRRDLKLDYKCDFGSTTALKPRGRARMLVGNDEFLTPLTHEAGWHLGQ